MWHGEHMLNEDDDWEREGGGGRIEQAEQADLNDSENFHARAVISPIRGLLNRIRRLDGF